MEARFDYSNTELVADILPANAVPNVLILHGAGQSNSQRYDYLREPLARDGIATCIFDHIGHGKTGGDVVSTSLEDRVNQASLVIDQLKLAQPLGLIGTSMGAYEAIKLTERYSVDRLVLAVPAVYDRAAYRLTFGDNFARHIRQPNNWQQTDAWEIVANYRGKLLVVAAEDDAVIPSEVPQRLYQAAAQASQRELYVVKGAGHQIREFFIDPQNAPIFAEYYRLLKQFLG